MKKIFLLITVIAASGQLSFAQNDKSKYPEPEFSKEIYFLKKDSGLVPVRLEKGSSKMDTKTKMGGMGGSESGYIMEGERSPVRLQSGSNLSFILSMGVTSRQSSPQMDSMMRANGMDPAMADMMNNGMMDPASMITLYKADPAKSQRKILMQKTPGMFGGGKMKSSDKFTFSTKKIRDGYWEFIVDKTLPRGEYIFTMMSMGMGSMDGSTMLFAFAID